ITKQTRGQDTSARIGGEEYAVILPDTDFQGAQVVAENIRKAVEKIVLRKATDNEKLATVTLSGGVAQLEFGEDGESLMHRADEALYKAKNGGRNQIVLAMAA
ncbi:MAG: GGDEF domain-containing protein, partial [Gammaproteobacteria bacterium]